MKPPFVAQRAHREQLISDPWPSPGKWNRNPFLPLGGGGYPSTRPLRAPRSEFKLLNYKVKKRTRWPLGILHFAVFIKLQKQSNKQTRHNLAIIYMVLFNTVQALSITGISRWLDHCALEVGPSSAWRKCPRPAELPWFFHRGIPSYKRNYLFTGETHFTYFCGLWPSMITIPNKGGFFSI